jgi:predicted PurR-regulated permease PerM
LLARVAISFVVAFVIGIGFWALGVDNAGVWAVLAAVLFAIPVAGPVAFIVAAGIASVLQFESPGLIAAVTALCVVTAAVEGNVLTPWLMSRAGDMNAVAVFVSLLFWGWIWGLWGVLLAFPITAAIKAVSERIPDMQPIAEFLKE